MRFKVDDNMKLVAGALLVPASMKKPVETVAVELCQRFVDAGMLNDDPDNYGEPFIRVTGPQYVSDICQILKEYLYLPKVDTKVFDAVCMLAVIGDGDCPECGSDLKFVETEGHNVKSCDRDCPPDYIIDYYIYQCPLCGKIIKSVKEL